MGIVVRRLERYLKDTESLPLVRIGCLTLADLQYMPYGEVSVCGV